MKILKKLFLIVLLGLFISIIPDNKVNALYVSEYQKEIAKPVTVIAGGDYIDSLTYDGYTCDFSKVDFNKEGTYILEYKKDKGVDTQYKYLYVVRDSNQNSITRLDKIDYSLTSNRISLVDSLYIDNYDYYLYKVTNNETDDETYYFESYYKKIQSRKISIGEKNSFILYSLLYIENTEEFIISGVLLKNNKKCIYYSLYNKDMKLIKEKYFEVNNNVTIKDSYYVDNYLYISGTTNSNTDFFYGCKDNDVFLLKINVSEEYIEESYISKVVGYEYMSDIIYLNDYIYVITSSIDSSGFSFYKIFKFNNQLIKEDEMDIGPIVGYDVKSMTTYNNKIYILADQHSYSYDKSISVLYVYNINLTLDYKLNINYTDYRLNGIDIRVNESGNVCLLFRLINNYNIYGYSLEVYNRLEKIYEYIDVNGYEPISFNNNDGNVINVRKDNVPSKITINSFLFSSMKILTMDSFSDLKEEEIIIDNVKYKRIPTYTKINSENNYFGNYVVTLGYSGNNNIFLISKVIYIKENINVEDNKEYNKDYKLEFNGTGYLNGKEIESNYQLTETGDYELEVYGKDGLLRKYSFKISDNISENNTSNIPSNTKYYLEKSIVESNETMSLLSVSNSIESGTFLNKSNLWIALIPLIIGIISSVCLIKIR